MDNVELESPDNQIDLRDWSKVQEQNAPKSPFALFLVRLGFVQDERKGRLFWTVFSIIFFILAIVIFLRGVFTAQSPQVEQTIGTQNPSQSIKK